MNTKVSGKPYTICYILYSKCFIVKYIEVRKNLLYIHTNLFSDLYRCKVADGWKSNIRWNKRYIYLQRI